MSAIRPYEPASTHWDTARERDVDAQLDAEARELDSREKLWADCEDLIRRIQERHFSGRDETALRDQFADLLDRQAAITERECIDRWDAKAAWKIAELRAKVDELAEERDRLSRQVELKDGIIEGLRKSLDETIAERNELAAKLEAKEQLERDSAYMRLPVDAEGVPIRPGDALEMPMNGNDAMMYQTTVETVIWDGDCWFVEDTCGVYSVDNARHIQSYTVESLLDEFADEVRRCCDDDATVADFAERIRKAVE